MTIARRIARARYRLALLRPEAFRLHLARTFEAERDRWFLWLPVLLGLGIGLYFAAGTEPPPVILRAAATAAAAAAFVLRRRGFWFLLALALAAPAAGMALAQWSAQAARAPVLTERLDDAMVSGRIIRIEPARSGQGARWLIAPARIEGLDPARLPRKIRLTMDRSEDLDAFRAGDGVRLRALLFPPPGPVQPGGFDFARRAWFQQIGGSGVGLGDPAPDAAPPAASADQFAFALDRLRNRIAARAQAHIGGEAGGIAAALIVGKRGGVAPESRDLLRDSGLAHILAISGLHMACFAGALFFFARAALALLPQIALRHPIKKWAVLPALAGAVVYLLLSGGSIATQRAFLMFLIVCAAILSGAQVLTMRNVALAAGAILIFRPESMLEASFQLSFAATTALVAAYEALSERRMRRERPAPPTRFTRLTRPAAALLVTSCTAWAATGLFAAYHFNRITLLAALAANLTALPVFTLLVMPAAIAALALLPFGLEALALAPMGWGIEAILFLARRAIDLFGPARLIRAPSDAVFLLAAAGGLWLCLWQRPWRYAGAALMALALAVHLVTPRPLPDLLVERDGRLIAQRGEDGRLYIPRRARGGNYTAASWLRHEGDPRSPTQARDLAGFRCNRAGCVSRMAGPKIVLLFERRGGSTAQKQKLCRGADIVIAPSPPPVCAQAGLVIDRAALKENGAYALWFAGGEIARIETSRRLRGARPWTGSRAP